MCYFAGRDDEFNDTLRDHARKISANVHADNLTSLVVDNLQKITDEQGGHIDRLNVLVVEKSSNISQLNSEILNLNVLVVEQRSNISQQENTIEELRSTVKLLETSVSKLQRKFSSVLYFFCFLLRFSTSRVA